MSRTSPSRERSFSGHCRSAGEHAVRVSSVEPGSEEERRWTWDPSLYAGSASYYTVGRVAYPGEVAHSLVAALELDGSERLLDVGCGPGSLTLLLATHHAEAIGVDADVDMLTEATWREAVAVLDEIFGNPTDMPLGEHTVDTAGQTLATFAIFNLAGLQSSPRIRDIGRLQLYRLGPSSRWRSRYPHAGPLLGQPIQTKALHEYGRLIRTIYLCRYVADQELRRRGRRQLNKGESRTPCAAACSSPTRATSVGATSSSHSCATWTASPGR